MAGERDEDDVCGSAVACCVWLCAGVLLLFPLCLLSSPENVHSRFIRLHREEQLERVDRERCTADESQLDPVRALTPARQA